MFKFDFIFLRFLYQLSLTFNVGINILQWKGQLVYRSFVSRIKVCNV